MSDILKIYCTNLNRYIPFEGGQSLLDIYENIKEELPFEAICARVNNKTEGLGYRLFRPKMVEFLPYGSSSGTRVYTRTLCMMLYKAVSELLPGVRLKIEHSVSRGFFCRLYGMNGALEPETVVALRDKMRELVRADYRLIRKERLAEHVAQIFEQQGLDDKVKLLHSLHDLYATYYTLDGLADSYYGSLAPHTGMISIFDLVPYHDGMLLLARDSVNPSAPATPLTQEKLFNAFKDYQKFNKIVGVTNVGELNEAVSKGLSADLINVSEALHNKRISDIADDIAARFADGGARIVLIAGPSSSGKTTFTKRLAIQLMTNLMKPEMISLDDYFVDRHHTPLDADGEYDYESLYALDLDQFNADLQALLDGKEVSLPTYNFATGAREYKGNAIKLAPDSILLIEGIHGLNPELTSLIDDKMKYKIYISALTTIAIDDHNWIPTTDNRLLRRIIRDHKYRGASAVSTIKRWPSVRRGEEKWIFPYQENADVMFNSSLLFELAVVKEQAERILEAVPRDMPEYAEAYRLRKFLSYFVPISPEYIPSTSLLREFLGGSSFRY
ncbi:MAG: nucleoside kinase [Pseudoflavonifractor sp.]|nr:nucleoside kinase [Alloprevotella sp.]MCM1116943.1 nucleoside kinase [Pseudoflavonifractor sp.]